MSIAIDNLHVSVGEKPILNGLTLDVLAAGAAAILGLDRGIIDKSGLIRTLRTL
ncbi:hypothetical protein [Brevundimonas mediterranea]|uniref:hypothetical protein n=1 Tax=Brevundimonas mediterranea TaxID=74329 RepID=UPI0012B69543|nr:hypothetical protein [Brevundimonas mediterranea]